MLVHTLSLCDEYVVLGGEYTARLTAFYPAPTDHWRVTAMTRVLVPYCVEEPKTRLAPVLSLDERRELSRCMLDDVLSAVREAGYEPTVLSTAPLSDVDAIVDERPLTEAVNAHLQPGQGVVMADLALATPTAVARLIESSGDVVLAPGRGGGTNALLTRHPAFRVDYHGASYRDHLNRCRAIGASVKTIDSYTLGTDIDEPDDLVELLLHGTGTATDWLTDRFVLDTDTDRRVGVERA